MSRLDGVTEKLATSTETLMDYVEQIVLIETQSQSGRQFDPPVIAALLKLIKAT